MEVGGTISTYTRVFNAPTGKGYLIIALLTVDTIANAKAMSAGVGKEFKTAGKSFITLSSYGLPAGAWGVARTQDKEISLGFNYQNNVVVLRLGIDGLSASNHERNIQLAGAQQLVNFKSLATQITATPKVTIRTTIAAAPTNTKAPLPTQPAATKAPLPTQPLPTIEPPTQAPLPTQPPPVANNCDPAYPGVCIPPAPPDLDCGDVAFRRFQVLPPDPHNFDGDSDGIGCES